MFGVRGRSLSGSRAVRRVFAKKSRPSIRNLSSIYIMRGGGYL